MKTMFILNREEEIVAVLSGNADDSGCHFFNSTLTLEINKGASLTFEVDTTEPDIVQHVKEENMVVVHDGENYRLLIIKEVSDIHESAYIKEVYCEDASAELIDEIIYDEVSGKVEMGIVLQSLLKGTRWEIGEVDNTYIRNVKPEFKLKTVLNGIQELAKQYDAEIDFTVEFAGNKITSRKVHMKKAFGRTLGKRFEFGKDTTLVKRTVNTADIKTAVVPFGATDEETGEVLTIESVKWEKPTNKYNKPLGQTYLEDEEATELWGYKGTGEKKRAKWIAITFEDCKDANDLINYASLQLSRFNKPKVSYEANVIDLFRMSDDDSYSFEKVMLGDLVSIVDHEFVPALALESRVVKLELDLNDTSNSKITLGTIVESIVDKDLKTQIEELNMKVSAVASNVDLSDIEDRLEQVEGETGTGKWEQIEEINNLIFGNAVGYHFMSENNGIWVFDKPVNEKPTKAVALKGGKIGLAKYDEQLQEWKVGTFIDGNSVNASMINTGTLKADRIEANALTVNHFNQELKTIINSVGNKADRTEVTTAIKTAVDEINLSVSTKYSTKSETESMKSEAIKTASSDATNKVNSAKTELTKVIDNIQVGGRNLLRNSSLEGITFPYTSTEYNWRTASVSESSNVTRTRVLIKDCPAFPQGVYGIKFVNTSTADLNVDIAQDGRVMEHGETYTISAYFKLTKGNPKFALQYGTTPYPAKSFNGSNEWVKCSFTFTYDKTQFSDKLSTNIYFGIRGNSFEGYACGFKLEKGTKTTDWTPSPEDVNSEINKKANSVDVYTKTETYTKAQTDSVIKVAKEEINLGVSSTYETKANVETKINNIQIGGRNLLQKTNQGVSGWSWSLQTGGKTLTEVVEDGIRCCKMTRDSVAHTGWSYISYGNWNPKIIKPSTKYTLSFEVKGSVATTFQFRLCRGDSGEPFTEYSPVSKSTIKDKWTKIEMSVTSLGSISNTIGGQVVYIAGMNSGVGVSYIFRNLKLEEGTKSSSWTPSIEDVDSEINKKANVTDVYTKSETYTKAQTDSAIKVAKDEINIGVKNTYETKTNVETKVNNAVNGIQIGGRNLGKKGCLTPYANNGITTVNDTTFTKDGGAIITRQAVVNNGPMLDRYVAYESGKKYVISFFIKALSEGITSFHIHNGYGHKYNSVYLDGIKVGTLGMDLNFPNDKEYHKVEVYFTAGDMSGKDPSAISSIHTILQVMKPTAIAYSVQLLGLKIEEGTKATDWTPAPEDVDSAIGSKANASEVYKKSETYTKNETDSKITVAKNEINLGVSSTYETKTNVTSKVNTAKTEAVNTSKSYADTKKTEAINSANASTDTKLKNYSTTTQMNSAIKVAKDSITNTVSQTYLSKGDATNTYATKSSLTQTANNITASFKSSGGYNLIRNSTGYNGINLWSAPSGGTLGTANNDNIGGASSIYMYLDNGTKTTESYAYSRRFKLKANTKYTLSGWFHNYTKCPNFDVYVLSSTSASETDTGTSYTTAQKLIENGNTNGGWKKFSISFTTPASVKSGIVRIDNNGYNSAGTGGANRVHWSALMLNEGEEQPWSPHPSEIYDGSTVIDASGITVKNGALKVQNKSGQTVLSGDSNGNLVIGGNSASGKLLLKNASGTTIGEMNQNGLILSDSAMVITSKYRLGESTEQKVTFDGANIKFTTVGGGTTTTVSLGADTGSTIGFNAKNGYHFYGGTARFDGGISQDGNVILNGSDTWLRTYGGTGWHNETYRGGWNMVDSNWIRSYGSKNVYIDKMLRADGGLEVGAGIKVVAQGHDGGTRWWVRFYDGTQICWGKHVHSAGDINMQNNIANNTVYGGVNINLYYPVTFTTTPSVQISVSTNAYTCCQATGIATNLFTARAWGNYASIPNHLYFFWMAIGRWK